MTAAPTGPDTPSPARRRARIGRLMRGTWRLAVANLAVAATFALTTAVLSLIVEDLLPQQPPAQLRPNRVAVLAGAVLLLLAAVWIRTLLHRYTGTLFYLRLLDDAMPDRHTAALAAAARNRMSLRPVTRWADLHAHTRNGIIDLTEPCRQIATGLETAVNTDRDDTGTTIAANLLWPAALAVGAELPIVDDLRLLELDDTELMFTLRPAQPEPGIIGRESSPADQPQPGPTAGGPAHAGRVGLILAFGKAATQASMQPASVFAGLGVSEWHRLRPGALTDISELETRRFTDDDLSAFARSLPAAVTDIKQAAGTRELVIAAALPKTLALALGWHLSQSPCRFFTGTHLLHHTGYGFTPMRTHPAQPTEAPTDETPGP